MILRRAGFLAREMVLATTPQGLAFEAYFVKWMMEHRKEAGSFAAVCDLVDRLSDNRATRLTAQEMLGRLREAEQRDAGEKTAPAA